MNQKLEAITGQRRGQRPSPCTGSRFSVTGENFQRMSRIFQRICYGCMVASIAMRVSAQQPVVYLSGETGTVTGNTPGAIFKTIDGLKGLGRGRAASLKKCLAMQLRTFYADRALNPPRGFVAKTFFHVEEDPMANSRGLCAGVLTTGLYYLERDQKNGGVKTSMDGTLIGIETNNLNHFLGQVGNFWQACDDLKVPEFFEELPVSDSSADYIELDFKHYGYPHITPGKPFRIVLGNRRPVFVPLKRKAFLEFVIAGKVNELKECKNNITDDEKILVEQGKLYDDPVLKSSQALIATTIAKEKQYIAEEKEKIEQLRLRIAGYKSVLAGMTPREAEAPVRLDYQKYLSSDPLSGLQPVGEKEGTALFTVNPNYYDASPGAPAAQLIVVYYSLPNAAGFAPASLNYLQQTTEDLFHRLDYHGLRIGMK